VAVTESGYRRKWLVWRKEVKGDEERKSFRREWDTRLVQAGTCGDARALSGVAL
jgi:hypothetical protein